MKLSLMASAAGVLLGISSVLEKVTASASEALQDRTWTREEVQSFIRSPAYDGTDGSGKRELGCGVDGKGFDMSTFFNDTAGAGADDDDSLDRNYITSQSRRWSNNVVPWRYDPGSSFTNGEMAVIAASMQHIEDVSCITFRAATAADGTDVVEYTKDEEFGSGCYSFVGFISFRVNIINLSVSATRTCYTQRIVVHEILHALGAFHEQTRPDRDDYINVAWQNLADSTASNFWKVQPSGGGSPVCEETGNDGTNYGSCFDNARAFTFGLDYDYQSIMHYFPRSFGVPTGSTVLSPLNTGITTIGRTVGTMSALDAEKLKRAYDCPAPNPPTNGNWGSWNDFGQCSRTCGGGTQTRLRFCSSPPPSVGGSNCLGNRQESRSCNAAPCPGGATNGMWSPWAAWGSCSAPCGGGTQSRSRTCTNPPPSNGGANCVGSSTGAQSCNTQACPINGNWASWGSWGSCSAPCGGGTRSRSRTCTNPPPSNGGANCVGSSTGAQSCNTQACSTNGNWANWGSWGSCSAPCGGGTRSRSRTCTNPAPSNGGAPCPGSSTGAQACNTQACSTNGNWANWGSWGSCSVSCGGGTRSRSRTCTNPAPSIGGAPCPGSSTGNDSCNTQPCQTTCLDSTNYFCRLMQRSSGWRNYLCNFPSTFYRNLFRRICPRSCGTCSP